MEEKVEVTASTKKSMDYAGFWLRFGAYIIDGIVLLPLTIFTRAIPYIFGDKGDSGYDVASFFVSMISLAVTMSYFSFMESSETQASFGKKALGLKVTDEDGNRLSLGKAYARNLGKIISALTIGIGFIMAGFTEKKQSLHDIMARALVVKA